MLLCDSVTSEQFRRITAIELPLGAEPGSLLMRSPSRVRALTFVPRMVVEEDYNRFTLKKIRVSDGEVVDIYESSTISLDRAAMFELLDQSMRQVYSDIARSARAERKALEGAKTPLDPDPLPPAAEGVPPTPPVEETKPSPPKKPAPRRR